MLDDRDRYWPRSFEELAEDPIPRSFINQPLPPDNVIALPKTRSLHAVLCEALIDTQALLARLESGVQVRHNGQREVVRALYVASRNQAKMLIATLECEGLE
jgi:hypothetical protein